MSAMSSSSNKHLLKEYHRLAAETLLGQRSTNIDEAVLSAAENGHYERMVSLLSQNRLAVNARCHMSGDTPIIAAARNGHQSIVKLLLKHGADLTLQNDQGENGLDVASPHIKKVILDSIQHEDRAMTNAQALLQSAWLGDAVSVKKYLSGSHYLNVNCHNSDGVTPLLLVTRDIKLFEKVQSAIENNYNPVEVMQNLLDNHADINACDKKGQSALHLVANSESVHARKMVSLLMKSGSSIDAVDSEQYSPLHVASGKGHTAIIVALVEEGGADVNIRGGERGDTPLMLSARGGHSEAARYLLAKGADVTAVDENGDSAITVAKTPSMVKLLKEAWVEQTQSNQTHSVTTSSDQQDVNTSTTDVPAMNPPKARPSSVSALPHPLERSTHTPPTPSGNTEEMQGDSDDDDNLMSPQSFGQLSGNSRSFFITARQLSKSLADLEDESDCTDGDNTLLNYSKLALGKSTPFFPVSEAEADDEAEVEYSGHRRTKPATRRAHIRANFEESITKRKVGQERRDSGQNRSPKHSAGGITKNHSLPRHMTQNYSEMNACSSADEDHMTHGFYGNKESRSKGRGENSGHRRGTHSVSTFSGRKSRPAKLLIRHGAIDHQISRSHDSLVSVGNESKSLAQEKKSSFLPQVVSSPSVPKKTRVSPKQKAAPDKLPSLTGMQAVALVSVDTDKERLKVHKFTPANEPTVVLRQKNRQPSITRSKSLMSVRQNSKDQPPQLSEGLTFGHTKRNSTGSVIMQHLDQQQPLNVTKIPLLPSVITPQFGSPAGFSGKQRPPAHHSKGPGRLQPLSVVSPTSPSVMKGTNLSNINEDTESNSLDKVLTRAQSLSEVMGGSKDSTLKASSHSDFESDSLERHGVVLSRTGLTSSSISGNAPMKLGNHQVTEMKIVPPTPRHNGAPQQSNVVVNYATKDSSVPLSPIWNRMQYLRTDSETSTNSEYITSYIGPLTPLPHVQPPYPGDWKMGTDSGHGESNDEDHGDGGSSQESGSEEDELEGEDKSHKECLKWKRGRLLGKGAYGKVWEGLMDSAKMIAVKEVELDCENPERAQSQYGKIQIEVEILRSLKHKNVVSYLGTSMEMGIVYIFMEFISGGSLQSILKRFGPLDCRTIAHYTRQITRALDYLHSNAIIHRDIKGANIMVTSKGVVKLIDFGCAKKYYTDGTGGMHSVRGTPYWMAPEVICGLGYGRKSDIWSLGCTVHEMATTKPPWADFPPEAAMFQIGIGKAVPPPPDHLSKKLVAFFYRCLIREPAQRPNATELLEDEFLVSMKKDSTSQP